MKVLMFSTDNSILESGSEPQIRMIEYGSLAEKLLIVVLSKRRVKRKILDVSPNVRVYSAWFWRAWRIGRMFKDEGVNLVTAQDPFETGLIGYLAARRLKAKLQLQIHTDFLSTYFSKESLKNRIRVRLAKWLLPKANSIRVVSERIKKSLLTIQQFNNSTISVLPIFVDVQSIQNSFVKTDLHAKYPQFDFIILMASRLTREKNILLAIQAMSEVVKFNSKVGLIIVGDGPKKSALRLEARSSKLETNIIFSDLTSEDWLKIMSSYYKNASVFLNTSNYVGYGRTLIEAAAAGGAAIITTDVGVVGEVINKDNCLVIPVGDKAALAQSILKLIEDENLRNKLSQEAQAAAVALGDKESYLQKHKQSWEMVL